MRKSSGFMSIIAILLCIFVAGNLIRGRSEEKECEHIYGEAVTLKQAKCEEEGATKQECLICGEVKVEKIPSQGGHILDESTAKVLKEATCMIEGVARKQCLLCSEFLNVKIPLTGEHTLSEEILSEATCLLPGEKSIFCTICKKTEIEIIPATGAHEWGPYIEEGAVAISTCSTCGITRETEAHKCVDETFDWICDICGGNIIPQERAFSKGKITNTWYRVYYKQVEDAAYNEGRLEKPYVSLIFSNDIFKAGDGSNIFWIFSDQLSIGYYDLYLEYYTDDYILIKNDEKGYIDFLIKDGATLAPRQDGLPFTYNGSFSAEDEWQVEEGYEEFIFVLE